MILNKSGVSIGVPIAIFVAFGFAVLHYDRSSQIIELSGFRPDGGLGNFESLTESTQGISTALAVESEDGGPVYFIFSSESFTCPRAAGSLAPNSLWLEFVVERKSLNGPCALSSGGPCLFVRLPSAPAFESQFDLKNGLIDASVVGGVYHVRFEGTLLSDGGRTRIGSSALVPIVGLDCLTVALQ